MQPQALLLLIILSLTKSVQSESIQCPLNEPDEGLYRLGESRFYLIKPVITRIKSYADASAHCAQKGMRLGTIQNLGESIYTGRTYEALVFKQRQLRNTLFYTAAKFDESKDTFTWDDTLMSLPYQNILYTHPYEIGTGKLGDIKQNCLVFGSPYPISGDVLNKTAYGWSTSMIEWPCKVTARKRSQKIFNTGAFCEINDPLCDTESASTFDIDPKSYEGLWPLANRRFVVSWEQMDKEDAEMFCHKHNLTLYTPKKGDECLLPYINDKWPDVTNTYFWTSVKYLRDEDILKYPNGAELPIYSSSFDTDNQTETCVMLSYTYERDDNRFSKCFSNWKKLVQTIASCKLSAGVICQHDDSDERGCLFSEDGEIIQENVISLGDKLNRFFRSVKKETFQDAESTCKKMKMELATRKSDLFRGRVQFDKSYHYDFHQDYWISSSNLTTTHTCKAAVIGDSYEDVKMESRDCSEKLFFLCKNSTEPIQVKLKTKKKSIGRKKSVG